MNRYRVPTASGIVWISQKVWNCLDLSGSVCIFWILWLFCLYLSGISHIPLSPIFFLGYFPLWTSIFITIRPMYLCFPSCSLITGSGFVMFFLFLGLWACFPAFFLFLGLNCTIKKLNQVFYCPFKRYYNITMISDLLWFLLILRLLIFCISYFLVN